MKMFNKASLSGFFGLSDDEDYDNSVYEEENKSSYAQPEKSTVKKETSYRQPTAPSYDSYEEPRKSPAKKVVAMSSQQNRGSQASNQASASQGISKKVTVLEPRTYTEAKKIAQCVFRNEIVIVNFHLIEESQARRIVDFLTGAVFGLDGDIQRIGDEMFLCTPPNMEIDSTVAKSLLGTQFAEY